MLEIERDDTGRRITSTVPIIHSNPEYLYFIFIF